MVVSSFNKIHKYYQANCLVRHDYCVGCLLQILQNPKCVLSVSLVFCSIAHEKHSRCCRDQCRRNPWTKLAWLVHGCMSKGVGVLEQERSSFFWGKKMKKGCTKIQILQYCNAFPAITSPRVLVGVDMITVGLHLSFSILLISTTGVPKLPCSFCQVEECFQID